ncbi:transposase [Streptomyces sp. NPDC049627]|uniref:transposase n=1 Tax=Streptomyces sp. NPDC049627 TaxID=3365595 RepID=UPI0037A9E2AC
MDRAVRVHAATDNASCPLEWSCSCHRKWANDHQRRKRAGAPDEIGHVSNTRLALGPVDRPAGQGLAVPVIVADTGYGRMTFRLALEERGFSYVLSVDPKEIARPLTAEPYQPVYGGLGPPTLPRYGEPAHPLPDLLSASTSFQRFTVLQVRPSGREACRTAQEQAGGRSH